MKRNLLLKTIISATFIAFILCFSASVARAQTTAFTYQGRFTDTTASQPTNGTYTMTFRLFDAETGGNQIPNSATAITSAVSVVNGIFTVKLNFGAAAFNTTGARYLEIQVGNTTLTTRQEITATPFANRAVNAASADALSTACVGCVTNQQINSVDGAKITGTVANAEQLGGAAASVYARTDSNAFILNQTTAQNANFSIEGTGKARVFNALTQFNIDGRRVLSTARGNLFVGDSAGNINATGNYNTFVGSSAGDLATTGSGNAFVGAFAGRFISTGGDNTFLGTGAGYFNSSGSDNTFTGNAAGDSNSTGSNNTFTGNSAGTANTTGGNNSFFGESAGLTNLSGDNNTLLGARADVSFNNLNYATAVGAGATVFSNNTLVLGRTEDAVRIPGNLNVTGTISGTISSSSLTDINASNITSGRLDNARLGIVPIAKGGTGSSTQNFVDLLTDQTVIGSKIFSGTTQTSGRLNVNGTLFVNGLLIQDGTRKLCLNNQNQLVVCLAGLRAAEADEPAAQREKIESLEAQLKQQQTLTETLEAKLAALTKLICATNPNADACRQP